MIFKFRLIKIIIFIFSLFGFISLIQLMYFRYNDYHVTLCKEAGWEFLDEKINKFIDIKTRHHFQSTIATNCYLKYGRTY